MKVRDAECRACHHAWVAPVVMSAHTSNLSGEATTLCPQCGSRAVNQGPQRDDLTCPCGKPGVDVRMFDRWFVRCGDCSEELYKRIAEGR